MKLILAIVNDSDVREVADAMMRGGFSITKIGSTGGILKSGVTTLISAVRNERVTAALDILRDSTHSRKYECNAATLDILRDSAHSRKYAGSTPTMDGSTYAVSGLPNEIVVGGATVFVLNIEDSYKF